jgi:hypothetical protein
MAFTVEDFQDLLRLLGAHPEWQAELRRHVLTDELLRLPPLVQRIDERLTQFQTATEQRFDHLEATVGRLAEAQLRSEERLDRLAEAQLRSEERLDRLEAAVERLTEQVSELTGATRRLQQEMGDVKGIVVEDRFRRRPLLYVGRLARDLTVLSDEEVRDMLDRAVADGALQERDAEDVLDADAVVRGHLRDTGELTHLVVEVSWGILAKDVERAERRSRLLGMAGLMARGVVAGTSIPDDVEHAARAAGVAVVLAQPPT